MTVFRGRFICPGCKKEVLVLNTFVWNGKCFYECDDCRAFREKIGSVTIQAEPWGLREARHEGYAKY